MYLPIRLGFCFRSSIGGRRIPDYDRLQVVRIRTSRSWAKLEMVRFAGKACAGMVQACTNSSKDIKDRPENGWFCESQRV